MFRFENSEYLYFLLLIPLFFYLFWLNEKRKRRLMLKMAKAEFVDKLLSAVSHGRVWLKFALAMTALAFMTIALSRPQIGTRLKTNTLSGIEIVLALDVSNSMMAQDVEPTRLDKAKQVVKTLSGKLKENKMALVVFAGNAFLQVPMSADNVSINMFLDAVNTSMVPTQGTSISEALTVSQKSFSSQKGVKRAIVLITDGEDHEGGADEILAELRKSDINTYILGIGSTKGSPVVIGNNYLRDKDGNMVISRLNEQMCKDIAAKANGKYIHIDNTNSAQEHLVDELSAIQRSNFETASYEDYNELFPWFAAVAILFLMTELFVSTRRNLRRKPWKWYFSRKNELRVLLVLLFPAFSLSAVSQSDTKINTHKGNVHFEKMLDSLAVISYKKAIAADSTNYKAHFNLGNTYLRQKNAEKAMEEYQKAATHCNSNLVKKAIYHNMGNIYYFSGQYDKAEEAFKEALRAQPKDDRTRYNLAMAQFMQKKNPQKQNPQSDQSKDKKDGDDKNSQQNQNNQQNQQQKKQDKQSMSKQNTEQMLRAVQMRERQTQEKIKHKQVPASRRYIEKNW